MRADRRTGLAIGLAGLLGACGGSPSPSLSPTAEELAAATYRGIGDEPVTLRGGLFEGTPFVEGGASRLRVSLLEEMTRSGDLDGDGVDEAVVLLTESSGGSGERIYLAAMKGRPGRAENVGTALVGDRVELRSARLERGRVSLEVLQAGEGDAMCCPGELARRSWALGGGDLVEMETEITGRLSLATLSGLDWNLGAETGAASPRGPRPTLSVEEDGSVAGFAGCNRFHGRLEDGEIPGSVSAGPLATTRRVCPPEAMETERVFLARLGSVESYGFRLGRLALRYRDGAGGGLLLFDPVEAAPAPP